MSETMDFGSITSLFNAIPLDWFIIGGFAILVAFEFLRAGSRRSTTLALALPIAMLAFSALSHAIILGSIIEGFSSPYAQALIFLALLVVMYVVVARIGISFGSASRQPIQAAVAGVALAAIFVVVWLQIPALDAIWHFGSEVQDLFGEQYRFWWLIGSYVALSFARSR